MRLIISFLLIFVLWSCNQNISKKTVDIAVIPQPEKVVQTSGAFYFNNKTTISFLNNTNEMRVLAKNFADKLSAPLGFKVFVESNLSINKSNTIFLVLNEKLNNLEFEGYHLEVTKEKIVLEAPTYTGLYYGIQTLRQLLPHTLERNKHVEDEVWSIPCVSIFDKPRFAWRGYMKDVSRTFYNVDVIKKYLDIMALYKMNVFHFHLTDDQGWRIEIKNFPKLTTKQTTVFHTSHNQPATRSGYYTQDELRDLVAYAAERKITIVPEIDLPGHCWPALLAYPELSVNQKTDPPYVFPFLDSWSYWGNQRTPNTFDPTNEKVYEFLDVLFEEVVSIFPSQYIHFGGDEVKFSVWDEALHIKEFLKKNNLKDNKDLQSYFVARVSEIIKSKGRIPIGWNDILEGDHEPLKGAVIMSWLGENAIKEAVENGFKTVATPTAYTYFDITQADRNDGTMSDLAYGNINSLERIYKYEPTQGIDTCLHHLILGVQANMWTAIPQEVKDVNVQNFPRLLAVAELAWSSSLNKDYDYFNKRLNAHFLRLDELKVDYYKKGGYIIGTWTPDEIKKEYSELTWDVSKKVYANGRINAAFFYTQGQHFLEIKQVELYENNKLISKDVHWGLADDFRGTHKSKSYFYRLNVDNYKNDATYTIKTLVKGKNGIDSYGNFTFNLSPYKPFSVIE